MTGTQVPLAELRTIGLDVLPWQRRERTDANIRRAISDLRALAAEDVLFAAQYRAMADAFQSALSLLDAIEDAGAGDES